MIPLWFMKKEQPRPPPTEVVSKSNEPKLDYGCFEQTCLRCFPSIKLAIHRLVFVTSFFKRKVSGADHRFYGAALSLRS